MSQPFHIAIDGPVAAGCSTVARLVAERLGFLYIDTGAMYRAAALLALRNQVDLNHESAVVQLIRQSKLELRRPTKQEMDGRLITVLLDGEDISWQIRTNEVSRSSAVVSQHPQVRQVLVKTQQHIAHSQNVIMEGRDIGINVLPQADLKIFLTASEVVRTKRHHLQALSSGRDVSFEYINQELVKRDRRDMNRKTDPLRQADDAMLIDSSDLSIDQIVNLIQARVKARRGELEEVRSG